MALPDHGMWLTPPSGNAVFDEEVAVQCDWGR